LFIGSEYVVDAFCSLLRRDLRESYKSKGNALVSVLAANILLFAFRDEKTWPEIFVRVYMEDALGERVWVDHPECKSFVDNILTAFNTKSSHMTSTNVFYPSGKPGEMKCTSQ
jgi:integrator complex subunit 1